MQIFLIAVLGMIFFFLFKVSKDKEGKLKIEPRDSLLQKSSSFRLIDHEELKKTFNSKLALNGLTLTFVVVELIVFSSVLSPIEALIKVRASQLIPQKFNPIARFAANMDWDSKTIKLDASMSKAYGDKIENYIWRIDDGTSSTGSTTFTHTFKNPGYYYIQLSIVDADNQSDVATCRILIPPQELEQVATHERTVASSSNAQQEVKDIDYDWAPEGTFFNYSKMAKAERSYANLKSNYIESGCGYSNRGYNTNHNSYIDFFHNNRVQKALADIMRVGLIGVLFVPTIYLVLRRLIKKSQPK